MKSLALLSGAIYFLALLITLCMFGVSAALAKPTIFFITLAVVTFSMFAVPLGSYCYRLLKIHAYSNNKTILADSDASSIQEEDNV